MGFRTDVLGDEVGVLAQAIARSLDLDDDGVVEQPVEQRGGDDGIAEDLAPFGEAAVGGEDHGALLVAGVDELEEQVAAAGNDRQVADLVDDQERCAAEIAQALPELPFALGGGQRGDDVGQSGEVDALAGLDRLDGERGGQVALAGAGRAEQMHDLGTVDEGQLGQGEDAVAIERGLEGEVEAGERLDRGQPCQGERGLDAAVLADGEFLDEQLVESIDAVDLALFDAAKRWRRGPPGHAASSVPPGCA